MKKQQIHDLKLSIRQKLKNLSVKLDSLDPTVLAEVEETLETCVTKAVEQTLKKLEESLTVSTTKVKLTTEEAPQ